jgi:cytochrome c-type biogenesis protein CcmH/NrfG
MQQYRTAEAGFRHAAQTDPSNIEAVSNLGVAIFKQGRFAESIPFSEQAVANSARFMTTFAKITD